MTDFATVKEAESFLRGEGWRKAFTEDKEFLGWCKPWTRPVSVMELNETLTAAKKELSYPRLENLICGSLPPHQELLGVGALLFLISPVQFTSSLALNQFSTNTNEQIASYRQRRAGEQSEESLREDPAG